MVNMDKYIKLEDLQKYPIRADHCDKEHANEDFMLGIESVMEYAQNIPAADVAPVRHARWIEYSTYGVYECSACGGTDSDCSDRYWNHNVLDQEWCPNCGARMDRGTDDEKHPELR